MAEEKSFSDLLDELRPKVHWKVSLHDESKQIYRQVQKTYFEPLSLNACKMDIRTFYQSASPTTVNNLVIALTEDKNRLFDDTLFSESRKHALGFFLECYNSPHTLIEENEEEEERAHVI